MNDQNLHNDQEPMHQSYDELYLLYKEIDELFDCAGHDEDLEEQMQHKVRDRIKGLAISLGIHADFLDDYTQHCKKNNLVLDFRG